MTDLTAERLRYLLSYDAEAGLFTWVRPESNRAVIGGCAGALNAQGYRCIGVDGTRYRAHRLAWLYVTGEWPRSEVDHINGVRDDNRFENLRLVTSAQNSWNAKKHSDNSSGYKGVFLHKPGRWRARICIHGKSKHLGLFSTPQDAHAAYVAASQTHFGEYGRTA